MAKKTIQSVTFAGGNLFLISLKYLGDATQWNRIASLNSMTDPFFTDVRVLQIPPVDKNLGNGGVLEF